ncbi:hypothetical protein [Gynuella sunshinyii]|uniref:DUF4340 domain-containing protein n=1 Tax=Gynuella sunshinyii YC6258 TaxID=1445510 RepID=A0A0C5VRV1_9GAMM|nr:hypothetical protein [Gynuella sunshinyii]AJQ97362.1 hypothetical Protein YC6258_05332 [Gynuella sunshinyii YC6258]
MFKNKHITAALLIAPFLAIIAYFATDLAVGEKPQAAVAGQSYKLAPKSDCRHESGKCTLKNGDIEIVIRADKQDTGSWLFTLDSNIALEAAALVIGPSEAEQTVPVNMSPVKETQTKAAMQTWSLEVPPFDKNNDVLRVAVSAGGSLYFVETSAIFPEFITPFMETASSK